MQEEEMFKELDLSTNEGKVYFELIKHGKLTASEVSSKSGVPYGKIYVVLQNLIEKGLVQIAPGRTKRFVPSSPENLEKIIENKKNLLEEAKKKIKELEKIYEKKEKDFLIIGRGDKGFWKIIGEMKEAKEYGYNLKWDSKIQPGAIKKRREWRKKNKNVIIKTLARYDKETKTNVLKWMKTGEETRKFSNPGIALSIVDDQEVMIGLIKKDTTLLVRDESFAKVMKQLFSAAYDKAEKIKD